MNIQTTQFRDLSKFLKKRVNMASLGSDDISQLKDHYSQDDHPFPIYKAVKKYDYSKTDVPDEKDRIIINSIMNQIQVGNKIKKRDDQKIMQLILQNQPMITKYYKQGYPKCLYIGLISVFTSSQIGLSKIAANDLPYIEKNHKDLPMLLAQLGLIKSVQEPNSKWHLYYQKAIQYGQASGFLFYPFKFAQEKDFFKAYEYYKNAELLGWNGIACQHLGQIYFNGHMKNIKGFSSIYKSYQYFKKSKELGTIFNDHYQLLFNLVQQQINQQEKIQKMLQTTELTQALIVSYFFKSRFQQDKSLSQRITQNHFHFGQTINIAPKGSCSFMNKTKSFYNLCSPTQMMPSKGILALDEQTNFIESIYIYEWQTIPKQKLKLLHKLGTKIILHQYIRKTSSGSQLPVYRVQNPNKVEIIEMKQQKRISDEKLRQMGKILFKNASFKQCLNIYQFMQGRGSTELEVVYCNMGLCYEKLNDKQNSIAYFLKSLAVKKYLKSQYKLAILYIKEGQFQSAKTIISQIQACTQKQQLQQILETAKKQQKTETNVDLLQDIKRQKTSNLVIQMKSEIHNTMGKVNILQLKQSLLIYQDRIQNAIARKFDNDFEYIQTIKEILQTPQLSMQTLLPQNLKRIQQFFRLTRFLQVPLSSYIARDWPTLMEMKQRSLLNSLQHYCNALQLKGHIYQSIKIYQVVAPYCVVYSIKLSKLLRILQKYEQSIEVCEKALKADPQMDIFLKFQYFYSFILLEFITSKINVKQNNFAIEEWLQQSLASIQKIRLSFKKELNKNINFHPKDFSSIHDFLNYIQLKHIEDQLIKRSLKSENIINRIKILVGIKLAMKQKYDKSLKLVDEVVDKQQKGCEQTLFQAYLLKIKILNGQKQLKKAAQVIERAQKILSQYTKQSENYNIYYKNLFRQKINTLMKIKDVRKVVDLCEQIIVFDAQNYSYLLKKLLKFALSNGLQENRKLFKWIKMSKKLNVIYLQLNSRYKSKISKSSPHQYQMYLQIQQENQYNNSNDEQVLQNEQQHKLQDSQCDKQVANDKKLDNVQGYVNTIMNKKGQQCDIVIDPKVAIGKQAMIKLHQKINKICNKMTKSAKIQVFDKDKIRLKVKGKTIMIGHILNTGDKTIYKLDKLQVEG